MKLIDGKIGRWMECEALSGRLKWNESGNLINDSGVHVHAVRSWLTRDDWRYVETDAEKMVRLEATIRRARDLCAEYLEDHPSDSDVFAMAECIAEALK